jgi:cytochrome c-type biogenesis protein CcmE
MARTIAAAIGAALWIGLAAAQTGKLKDTQLNPDGVAASKRAVVIGCVSRDGNGQASRYLITDTRMKTPVQYRLDADPDLLRFHVGHMVEVAGPLAVARGAAGTGNAGTIKVEALTYLSTMCTKLQ